MVRPPQETGRQVPMRFLRGVTPFLAAAAVGLAACAPDPNNSIVINFITRQGTPTPVDGQPTPRPTETAELLPTKMPTVLLQPTAAPRPPTPRPNPTATPTRTAAGEFRTAALEKSPQDLYRALLAPFLPDEMPGLKVAEIAADNLNPTDRAFNAVGKVKASFIDPNAKLPGFPTIIIGYVVFSNAGDARAYSNNLSSQSNPNALVTIDLDGNVVIVAIMLETKTNSSWSTNALIKQGRAHLSKLR